MAPHQTFHIDDEAHRRCIELLSAAGLTFREKDRTSFRITEQRPEIHSIIGELSSPQGTFPCQLGSSASGCTFRVTVTNHFGILDEIERAFQGHLVDRR
jgi:hypothetical protein